MKRTLLTLFTLITTLTLHAEVHMPTFFSDGMVLQQKNNAPLWGTAKPNATLRIKTSWDNKSHSTHVSSDGSWRTTVMTPPAGGPYDITIDDGKSLTLRNVLIGEVWLCSGQSNMEMPMEGFKGQPVDGAMVDLMNSSDPNLHVFTVKRASAFTPQSDVVGTWQAANPKSIRSFSAAAYYFGKQLRESLNVPIGLILTSWGGSSCEAWMNRSWLKEFPQVQPENNSDPRNLYIVPTTASDIKSKNRTPTVLYNAMLHPLIGYSIRGVIWYQGEDNVPRYQSYSAMLSRMIKGWRDDWQQPELPFYFCQIAPYDYSLIGWKVNSALLREQQQVVEKTVSHTGMAVLMDAGLRYGIHPRKKREAGERLAMLALSDTYGFDGLSKNARYESVEFHSDTAVVRFDRSRMWIYFDTDQPSRNFEVAGSDRIFHPAKAWISTNRLYLVSPEVNRPVAVRYAFHNWAVADLFCDGLPISSFRTDTWDDNVDISSGVEYDK